MALQEPLAVATYLSDIIPACADEGLNIDAAINNEVANVLRDQGEVTASIRILQELASRKTMDDQDLMVGKADLLARIVSLPHR